MLTYIREEIETDTVTVRDFNHLKDQPYSHLLKNIGAP